MNTHDATELAFKNGYTKGKTDAVREICQKLRDDLRGEVDMEYLEKLIKIYETTEENSKL